MFEEEYRKEMSEMKLSQEQKERITELMTAAPVRSARRAGRMVLAAALVAVLCLGSVAAAYAMGAFDFLKEQDAYSFLGQTELYEKYAQRLEVSATAESGDMLTVERVAMDDKFFTFFYMLQMTEPADPEKELYELEPDAFTLLSGGEEVSAFYYEDGTNQVYRVNDRTIVGVRRMLLNRPLAEGETLELQIYYRHEGWDFDRHPSEQTDEYWAIPLTAHPLESERFEPGVQFTMQNYQVEVLSLERSPLGALLTLREELPGSFVYEWYQGVDFALRNADTGEYIRYGRPDIVDSLPIYRDEELKTQVIIFELYGDVSDLKNLEFIPLYGEWGPSRRTTVPLDALPAPLENPDGGYVPASVEAEGNQITVTWEPQGATSYFMTLVYTSVDFLDAEGESLYDRWLERFANRTEGTLTHVYTTDREVDMEEIAAISYSVQEYSAREAEAVTVPLTN